MKKLNTCLTVGVIVLFAMVIVSGCRKIETNYSPEKEASLIHDWLDRQVKNNSNIDTTYTGLFYIVDKVGTGRKVLAGDELTVQYTGMFLNGTIFDADPSFTYIHKLVDQPMIQGWVEGIEVLSKGGSALFLIPSEKAYGVYGWGTIPPFTPLLFKITVIDIK